MALLLSVYSWCSKGAVRNVIPYPSTSQLFDIDREQQRTGGLLGTSNSSIRASIMVKALLLSNHSRCSNSATVQQNHYSVVSRPSTSWSFNVAGRTPVSACLPAVNDNRVPSHQPQFLLISQSPFNTNPFRLTSTRTITLATSHPHQHPIRLPLVHPHDTNLPSPSPSPQESPHAPPSTHPPSTPDAAAQRVPASPPQTSGKIPCCLFPA